MPLDQPDFEPAPDAPPPEPKVVPPARNRLLEILLDPRSLQHLMTFGAGLLVLGLVVWMWAVGIFENKLVVAGAMGAGTVALLAGGWALLKLTRHEIAGHAVTLLACFVMPLNLWFYHAQGLVTLEGHLWMAGVVCCALYAATALVLRRASFVYVAVMGITLTGLLILADEHVQKLWEIAAPSTMLVIIGMLCIHAERAFPLEGEFSRKRFGNAFFNSGIGVLTAGLGLLLGAQLAGWLYPYAHQLGLQTIPEIAEKRVLQFLALGLVLGGTYAFVYSDLVVKRASAFLYAATFSLLWAEVLAARLLSVEINEEVAIIVLALTALSVNILQVVLAGKEERADSSLARVGHVLGIFLCTFPVLLGLELHLRATYKFLNEALPFSLGFTYVLAMTVTAASARAGAHVYRHTRPVLSATYFVATAAATLLAARGILWLNGVQSTDALAPWLMLIPLAYIVAARIYRGHTPQRPLSQVAQLATAVLIGSVICASVHIGPEQVVPISGHSTNLLLALFFAEAAVFYGLAAALEKKSFNIYLAAGTACGAAWQLLSYGKVDEQFYTVIFAIAGLALVIVGRFTRSKEKAGGMADSAFVSGNTLLSLSFVAAILMTASRLLSFTNQIHASLLGVLALLIASGLLAAWVVKEQHWRRWYIVTTVTECCLAFLVVNVLSTLTIWEKMEFFTVAVGLLLLAVGHVGWYRERERTHKEEWVSSSLAFGAILATLPLVFAVVLQRSHRTLDWTGLRMVNELGMLAIGLLMLGTGTLFKLRATTIMGALTMGVYVLSLGFFIHIPEKLQTVAIYMMVGGGAFFVTAVLLSIYRDKLMALPGEIKRREGVFRVLNWR